MSGLKKKKTVRFQSHTLKHEKHKDIENTYKNKVVK